METRDEILIKIRKLLSEKFSDVKRKGINKSAISHFIDTVDNLMLSDDIDDFDLFDNQIKKICNLANPNVTSNKDYDSSEIKFTLKVVSLLHDILEDTDVTVEDLKDIGITDRQIELIQILTRNPNQPTSEYLEKIIRNPEALTIKLADRISNMEDLIEWVKIEGVTKSNKELMNKYDIENLILTTMINLMHEDRYNIRKQLHKLYSLSHTLNNEIKELDR